MMAAGKRPVPFRTRKLSPPAPMVLPPGGSGRVGYRRPNNFTHGTRHTTDCAAGAFLYICNPTAGRWRGPIQLTALRTTTPAPIIGAHQPVSRPGDTPHCGQPGRHHPAGRDLPRRTISRGASTRSHDDAYCGAKVEYRTSSAPAYTDALDLHYSTNNAPARTRGRTTLRIADYRTSTNNGEHPEIVVQVAT